MSEALAQYDEAEGLNEAEAVDLMHNLAAELRKAEAEIDLISLALKGALDALGEAKAEKARLGAQNARLIELGLEMEALLLETQIRAAQDADEASAQRAQLSRRLTEAEALLRERLDRAIYGSPDEALDPMANYDPTASIQRVVEDLWGTVFKNRSGDDNV